MIRLAVLLWCLALPTLAEGRLVAVLEFRNKVKGGEVDAGYLADVVRTAALDAAPGVRVMTRENMVVLLQSTGKKLEECEGECEVDTGRRLGADLVVSGEALKFGSRYKLDLRMHETANGQLLSGAQASGKTLDELDDAIHEAVKKLFLPLASRPAPQAAARAAPPPEPAQAAPVQAAPQPQGSLSVASIFAQGCGGDQTACSVLKDCQGDAKKCFSLASGYENGNFGFRKSAARAVVIYEHGCAAGDANCCMMAMNKWAQGVGDDAPEPARARQYGNRACRLGHSMGCFMVMTTLKASPEEAAEAEDTLRDQCRADGPDACWFLARGNEKEQAASAKARLAKLCDGGNATACSYMKNF